MRAGGRPHVPWWAWPSVLSLDAPAVAVAWSWAIAHAAGASFVPAHAVLLALATAAVYLLDRIRDAGRLSGERPPPLRHAWVARHRRSALVAACGAAAAAVLLALRLPPTGVLWAAGVAVAAVGVLTLPRGASPARPVAVVGRPAAVGAVFAAGAALPAVAVGVDPRSLAPSLVALAAVAALNVAMIAAWEADLDDGAAATPATEARGRWGRAALALSVACALSAWATSGRPVGGDGAALASAVGNGLAAPLALGAALLAALEAAGARLPSEARHLAADAALLVAALAAPAASSALAGALSTVLSGAQAGVPGAS